MASDCSCWQVVEHLDPPELHALGAALLGRCAPRALVVTTPNKEYNLNMMMRCTKATPCDRNILSGGANFFDVQATIKKRFCKACATFVSGRVPDFAEYPKRTLDHRFEWTRAEFRQWAAELAAAHGYDVSFDGVGGAPIDDPRTPRDQGATGQLSFIGPGPLSQIAIFIKKDAAAAAGPVAPPMAS